MLREQCFDRVDIASTACQFSQRLAVLKPGIILGLADLDIELNGGHDPISDDRRAVRSLR